MNGKVQAARGRVDRVNRAPSIDEARMAKLGAAARKLARPSHSAPAAARLGAKAAAAAKLLRRG